MKRISFIISLLLIAFLGMKAVAADALYLAGEHNSWATDDEHYAFTLDNAKGVFFLDITFASATQAKLTVGQGWNKCYGGTYAAQKLMSLSDIADNITFPAGSWRILVKQDCSQMLVVPQGQLYVVGEYPGTSWDFSTAVKGTFAGGKVTWDMGDNAPARDFSVKFIYVNDGDNPGWSDLNNIGGGDLAVNGSITGAHGSGSNIIPKNGTKTLTYEWAANKVSSTGEAPAPEPSTLYVVGTNSSWIPEDSPAMTIEEDGTYTYNFGHIDSEVEFKILTKKAWEEPYYGAEDSNPLTVGDERTMINGGSGMNFKISRPGTYAIQVDLENLKLKLTGTPDPVANEYNIVVNEAEHGTVTADKTKAQKDETVKLNITPEAGYQLETLQVKAGEQNVVIAGDNTFKMPASDVTVSATFKAAPLYVLGNIPSLGEWNPEAAKVMLEDSHGVWHYSLGHVNADTQFKFIIGNSSTVWDDKLFYGPENGTTLEVDQPAAMTKGGSGDFIIARSGSYNLTVNNSLNEVTLSGTADRANLSIKTSADEWSASEGLIMADDNTQSITKAMTEGTQFKFIDQNGVWYGAEADGVITKDAVTQATALKLVAGDEGKNFVMPVGAEWKFTVDADVKTITITGQWPEEPEPTPELYVLGNVEGSSWNLTGEHLKLTYDTEKKIFTGHININLTPLGYFTFATKIVNDWEAINPYRVGGSEAGETGNCDITAENQASIALAFGTSDWSFPPASFCIAANEGGYDLEVDLEHMTMKVIGDIPSLQPTNCVKLARWGYDEDYQELDFTLDEETGKYVLANQEFTFMHQGFKVIINQEGNTTWLGGEGEYMAGELEITADKLGQTLQLENPGQDIMIPAGTYTFTFDFETLTLVVTGEMNMPRLYLVGNCEQLADWDATAAPEMTRDGYIYTYQITTEESLEFKVLLQQNWDGGDFGYGGTYGTAITLGQAYDLSKPGANFIIEEPGTYVITVNGLTHRLTVSKPYLKGDVNGDGEVGIADMTALSNLLLEETSNERSDVNEDGETSIADITTLVNILLEQEN